MPLEAMEIRELTDEELVEELTRAKDEIARLRYRAAFEELENPSLLRDVASRDCATEDRAGRASA